MSCSHYTPLNPGMLTQVAPPPWPWCIQYLGIASARVLPRLAGRRLAQTTDPVVGYVPSDCAGLDVSVSSAQSEASSWLSGGSPIISGTITLTNSATYAIPVTSVLVTASSSLGQLYSALADCAGSANLTVPAHPMPYSSSTVECSFNVGLDQEVFAVMQKSVSGTSDDTNSERETWTVTANATVGMSNAQCGSVSKPINTSSWWAWLDSWLASSGTGGGIDSVAATKEETATNSEAPVASEEASVASGEASEAPVAPVASNEAPVASDQAPVSSNEAPLANDQAPVASNQAASGEEAPVNGVVEP